MFPILSTDKASMKSQVQIFDMFSSLLAKYLGIAVIMLSISLRKNKVIVLFYILNSRVWKFQYFKGLLARVSIASLFDFRHSSDGVITSLYGFSLHFPRQLMIPRTFFICLLVNFIIFFREVSIHIYACELSCCLSYY